MTDAAEPTPAVVRANVTTPWSTGARTLISGFLISALAVALVLMGSSSNPDDPNSVHSALVLGLLVGVIGLPILLVGIIAVGVRMGLDDRDGD